MKEADSFSYDFSSSFPDQESDNTFAFSAPPPSEPEDTLSYDMPEQPAEVAALNPGQSRQQGGVLWLVTGLLAGMLVAVLTVLLFTENHETHHLKVSVQRPNEAAQQVAVLSDQMLAAGEAVDRPVIQAQPDTLPQHAHTTATHHVPQHARHHVRRHKPHGATATGARYMLQVASVPRYADADQLKARLALMGYPVSTQKVKVKQHTWHRVRVGPYANKAAALSASHRLAKNHIQNMMLSFKS